MARSAGGLEFLAAAKEMLVNAKTIEELRQAQAVILPLEYGFSIEQLAAVLGVSRGWACQLRQRFIRNAGKPAVSFVKRGGRRRENMSTVEEKAFLAPFLDKAEKSGILVVGEVKQALDSKLGREVALTSVYNLLHRHNWQSPVQEKKRHQASPG